LKSPAMHTSTAQAQMFTGNEVLLSPSNLLSVMDGDSRIPAQEGTRRDQMIKVPPQLTRHLAAHKQHSQLKIAKEGIVRKIGA
jgi:hypothetical protein